MAERCRRLGLASELLDCARLPRLLRRKNLHRDLAPKAQVVGQIHSRHAAARDLLAQRVAAVEHGLCLIGHLRATRNCTLRAWAFVLAVPPALAAYSTERASQS